MKRRKSFVRRILLIVLVFCLIQGVFSIIFVNKGEKLEGIIYKSDNVILQIVKGDENSSNVVIVGTGYSLNVDEDGRVITHDPFLMLPNTTHYNSDTMVINQYFTTDATGLQEAGEEWAIFLNTYLQNYEKPMIVAHSKSAVCIANATQWTDRKLQLVLISAPYTGTRIVDRVYMTNLPNSPAKWMYQLLFSNHLVDKDLIPNSEFMQNVNYNGIERNDCINIISTVGQNSSNILDKVLNYIDDEFAIQGDGIVPAQSQQLPYENVLQISINASHATSYDIGVRVAKEYILKHTKTKVPCFALQAWDFSSTYLFET